MRAVMGEGWSGCDSGRRGSTVGESLQLLPGPSSESPQAPAWPGVPLSTTSCLPLGGGWLLRVYPGEEEALACGGSPRRHLCCGRQCTGCE